MTLRHFVTLHVLSWTLSNYNLHSLWLFIILSLIQIGNSLRCPASKFITHTLSHICFLILLAAATFQLDERTYPITFNITTDLFDYQYNDIIYKERLESVLKATFRPANKLMTNVQICLMFWILGECDLSRDSNHFK